MWYGRSSIAIDLLDAADDNESMRISHTMTQCTASFKKKHEPPAVMNSRVLVVAGYRLARRGRNEVGAVELYEGAQWLLIGQLARASTSYLHVYYRDRELLVRAAEDEGLLVQWDTVT